MTAGTPWSGWDGIDPWLPDRLAANATLAAGEWDLLRELWAALTGWLTLAQRTVLRGGTLLPPDPTGLYAVQPAWATAVDDLVNGPVRRIMADAYEALFGPGYRYDARPAVAAHLAQVRNRMVRTTEAAFDLVAAEIAAGSGRGEGIPQLAERVDHVLSATGTERWPRRATVVARTESIGAHNAGRNDAFAAVAEELGEPMEHMWLATADTRTRPTHRAADGQRVPVGRPFLLGADPTSGFAGHPLRHPGDPAGPAHEVIQCRCTTLLLRPGEDVDLSGRQYTDW